MSNSTMSTQVKDKHTSYFTIEELKLSLQLQFENTKHDNTLIDIIESAHIEVDSRLKKYIGPPPMTTGTDVFVQAKKASLRYARSLFYERIGQLERSKHSDEMYETKITAIIESIIADKPDRTKAVFISDASPLEKLYQPSQIDEFFVREF